MQRKRRIEILAAIVVECLLLPSPVRADPPSLIRYQARLADAAGVSLTGIHNLTFAIFSQEVAGTPLWTEGPLAVNVGKGGVDLLLGEITPLTSAVLAAPNRWLQVTVDGAALTPRQRLASVPFSFVADRLGTMTLTEIEADVDARIGAHASDPSVHHVPVPLTARFVVDAAGSGDFTDIQSAVSAAPPVCSESSCGALIMVRAGLYELSAPIVIDRAEIHLVGAELVKIRSIAGPMAQINLMEITNTAGITIENLTAGGTSSTHPHKTTIQIQNSDEVLLRNNIIEPGVSGFDTITIDATSRKIVIESNERIGNQANRMAVMSAGSFVRIANNTFEGNSAGGWVMITGTDSSILGNSFVQGETIQIVGDRNTVASNVIFGETIQLSGDRNIVADNILRAHDAAAASGKILILTGGMDNIVTGNIMLDAGGSPTLVSDNGTNTILRGNLGNPDKN